MVVDAGPRAPELLYIDKDRVYFFPIDPDKHAAMFAELGFNWRDEFCLATAVEQARQPVDKDELQDSFPQLRIPGGAYTETANVDALRVHIQQLELQVPTDQTHAHSWQA